MQHCVREFQNKYWSCPGPLRPASSQHTTRLVFSEHGRAIQLFIVERSTQLMNLTADLIGLNGAVSFHLPKKAAQNQRVAGRSTSGTTLFTCITRLASVPGATFQQCESHPRISASLTLRAAAEPCLSMGLSKFVGFPANVDNHAVSKVD
jgi:hypothetical protein